MTRLDSFYREFAAVLRSVPQGAQLLDSALLPEDSGAVQVADLLGAPASVSMAQKLAAQAYSLERRDDAAPSQRLEGPMLLFHDLKLAFGRTLAELPQDSEQYTTISDLFKFAVDLFVREAHRLGLMLSRDSMDSDLAENDEHFFRVSQGFQAIRTEVQEWNGETFWVTAANGPLFMSASNKAPVDPRQTAAAGSVHTARLLPHIARAPESTLGFVSPLNPRFPQPNYPPTDLLGRFVHANGHNTLAPVWITGEDGYASFAPTVDSTGAVVGEQDAANVWVERASENTRPRFARDGAAAPNAEPAQPKPESGPAVPPANGQPPLQKPADPLQPAPKAEIPGQLGPSEGAAQLAGLGNLANLGNIGNVNLGNLAHLGIPDAMGAGDVAKLGEPNAADQDDEVVDVNDVDLDSLLRWTPYNFVDDDELEAAAKGTEHELVSRLLLDLQYLQRQRLSTPGADLEVGDGERHLALKTQNILARLVDGAKLDSIGLRLDTRLPVLMRNYAGSLPAATDPALHAPFPPQQPQPQRLQGLDTGAGYRPPGPGRPRGVRR